ncbi:hypothetical protein DID88_007514 [Monilinia fructigena]|uniref:Uncharacterized protein n=1 Tax=Monilinia fructigena TaxID=38457 RepID=A0A395J314_9HELO|nr:hypothetical protein DID88_007514 [Monilinia fructigena]
MHFQILCPEVTWNSVPEGYQFQTLSNLWVTTWDYEVTQFSQLLTKNINANSSDAKYVLRFKDLDPVYNSTSKEVSSTGFLVINGGSSSSTASATKTSSTQTISSASSTSFTSTATTRPVTSTAAIATPSATSTSISNARDSDLSGGAKSRRRRYTKGLSHEAPPHPLTEPPTYHGPAKQYYTPYTNNIPEIGGRERAELQGN